MIFRTSKGGWDMMFSRQVGVKIKKYLKPPPRFKGQ